MKKTAIITGATGQLGAIVSQHFLDTGYQVVGTMRPGGNPPDELRARDHLTFEEIDLLDGTAVGYAIERLRTRIERIDAVVCLAGGFGMDTIADTSEAALRKMYNINFLSAFHIVQAGYAWMKETGGGSIVLVGAKPVLEGNAAEMMSYTLSKSLLFQLASILNESGVQDHIQTSVIVPSVLDTPANRKAMPHANPNDWVNPADVAAQLTHLVAGHSRDLRNTILRMYGNS